MSFRVSRFIFVVAAVQLLHGLVVFAAPKWIWAGAFGRFASWFPLVSALLVIGAAALITASRYACARQDLRNSRAEESRQAETLAVLVQIASSVRSSLDLGEVLRNAVTHVGKALDADRCFVRLRSDETGLPVVSEYLIPGAASVATLGPLPPSLIMTTKKGSVMHDVINEAARSPDEQRQKDLLLRLGTTASMAAPILVDGEAIGVIAIHYCRGPRQWQPNELLLLEHVGMQAGVAIALAESHQALMQRYQELDDTYQALNTAFDRLSAQDEALRGLNEALRSSEARFANLLEIAPNSIVATDEQQNILLFNRAATHVFGYTEEEVLGKSLDMLLPERFAVSHRTLMSDFVMSHESMRKSSQRRELEGRRKDGTEFPAEIAISKFALNGETYSIAIVQDISKRKKTERTLLESEERFRSAFENAPIGVVILDSDGRCIQANQAIAEILGYTEAELLSSTPETLLFPEDLAVAHRQMAALAAGEVRVVRTETRLRHRDGHEVWVIQNISRAPKSDGSFHFISQVQDITERKRYEANLLHLATRDPLTELYNRRRFEQELEAFLAMSRNFHVHGAVCFLDLDHFKYINDTLGHQAGDELLCRVARLLRANLRATDIIARLGGDEFAILLPYTGEEAIHLAERILEELRQPGVTADGNMLSVTGSIGITFFPAHGATAGDLLAQADVAMYRAKEKGRGTYAVFEGETGWREEMESKLSWENRIREALQENRFVLYYQPILDLRTGEITHHELLLRMVSPDGHLIAPGAFLDVAERFGLIQAIDRWVVCEAIHLLARELQVGRNLVFEVNLSGKTISDPDMLRVVQTELERTGVNPANLVLEITETAAIGDLDQARRFITAMKQVGCRIALDDVGAGFSSLTLIKHLPVDYIKIDGSFIKNLPHDRADQHLVMALVAVARELGKQTIAEFVDSEETLHMLEAYGVDYAQGFLIGRPGPQDV